MKTFTLPDLGEGLQEAEIVAWHVSVGDHVVADQPLLSVETDKAVVEVPSPQAGRIAALHGAPGDIVEVGAALVEFGAGEESTAVINVPDEAAETAPAPERPRAAPAARPGKVKAAPAVRQLAERLGVDLSGLGGSGPGGAITAADVEGAAGRHDRDRRRFGRLRGVGGQ